MEVGLITNREAPALTVPNQAVETPEIREERRQVIKAVKAVNKSELFGQNNEVTFVFHRETHRPLLRIVDRVTREVVRQIPPEQVLRLAEELEDD